MDVLQLRDRMQIKGRYTFKLSHLVPVSMVLSATGALSSLWENFQQRHAQRAVNAHTLKQDAMVALKDLDQNKFWSKLDIAWIYEPNAFPSAHHGAVLLDARKQAVHDEKIKLDSIRYKHHPQVITQLAVAVQAYKQYIEKSGNLITQEDLNNLNELKDKFEFVSRYNGGTRTQRHDLVEPVEQHTKYGSLLVYPGDKTEYSDIQTYTALQKTLKRTTEARLDTAYATLNQYFPIEDYGDCAREMTNINAVLETYRDYKGQHDDLYAAPLKAVMRKIEFLQGWSTRNPEKIKPTHFDESLLQLKERLGTLNPTSPKQTWQAQMQQMMAVTTDQVRNARTAEQAVTAMQAIATVTRMQQAWLGTNTPDKEDLQQIQQLEFIRSGLQQTFGENASMDFKVANGEALEQLCTTIENYTFEMASGAYKKVLVQNSNTYKNPTSENGVNLLKAIKESLATHDEYRASIKNKVHIYEKPIIELRAIISDLETQQAIGLNSNTSPEFIELLKEVKTQAQSVQLRSDRAYSTASTSPSTPSLQ